MILCSFSNKTIQTFYVSVLLLSAQKAPISPLKQRMPKAPGAEAGCFTQNTQSFMSQSSPQCTTAALWHPRGKDQPVFRTSSFLSVPGFCFKELLISRIEILNRWTGISLDLELCRETGERIE